MNLNFVSDSTAVKVFNTSKNWNKLSAVMAEHMNWSVAKCVKYLLRNNK